MNESEKVHCESIATRGQKQPWSIDETKHFDMHQFFWVTRGGGRVSIDGKTHGFGPNTSVFIPSLLVHSFEFTPGAVGWVVNVAPELQIALPTTPVIAATPRPAEQAQLTAAFTALNAEYVTESADREVALYHHAGLLALRYKRMTIDSLRKDVCKNTARRKLMRKFIERLEERYSSDDTVKDYAGALSITTTHLTRICRETTGKPATKVIQDRTMLEARRNLAQTNMRVSEIAETLGFHTPAYFTRVFTNNTGKSPRNFRKEARQRSLANPNSRQVI